MTTAPSVTAEEFIARKRVQFAKERDKAATIPMKDIGRKGKHHWIREVRTFKPQTNYPSKVFVIERLRFNRLEGESETAGGAAAGDIEYRIGYYVLGKIGNKRGRWTWGQYCPLIPHNDLLPLFELAKTEGTILSA